MSKISLLNKLTDWYRFNFTLTRDGVELTEVGEVENTETYATIDDVLKEFVPYMVKCNIMSKCNVWADAEIQFIQSL